MMKKYNFEGVCRYKIRSWCLGREIRRGFSSNDVSYMQTCTNLCKYFRVIYPILTSKCRYICSVSSDTLNVGLSIKNYLQYQLSNQIPKKNKFSHVIMFKISKTFRGHLFDVANINFLYHVVLNCFLFHVFKQRKLKTTIT